MCNADSDATTADTTDGCCGGDARTRTDNCGDANWLDGPDVLDQQLPVDLQTALGSFVGRGTVDTLAEWASEIRRHTGGGSIEVDQLCHTDEKTDHWGDVNGERYHFRCFYDAVVLAALEDRPVDVHSISPDDTVVEARAVGSEELSVTPESAVFSLGIARDAHERSDGNPTLQDSYAAICPYVKAFPDRDAYEAWADDDSAVTVATPLSGATAFAQALTE